MKKKGCSDDRTEQVHPPLEASPQQRAGTWNQPNRSCGNDRWDASRPAIVSWCEEVSTMPIFANPVPGKPAVKIAPGINGMCPR